MPTRTSPASGVKAGALKPSSGWFLHRSAGSRSLGARVRH